MHARDGEKRCRLVSGRRWVVSSLVFLTGTSAAHSQDAAPAAWQSILLANGETRASGNAAEVGAMDTEDAVRAGVPTGMVSDGRPAIE